MKQTRTLSQSAILQEKRNREIFRDYNKGISFRKLGKIHGLSYPAIHRIVKLMRQDVDN